MPDTSVTARPGGLEAALRARRDGGAKLLIPYVMAGMTDDWIEVLQAIASAGADAIEVGLPFSDPMIDGPVVQAAGLAAFERHPTIQGLLDQLAIAELGIPVAVMTYYNLVFRFGHRRFAASLVAAGVSAAIVPDLPLEELDPWAAAADAGGIELLHHRQGALGERQLLGAALRIDQVFELPWQPAVGVQAVDDPLGHLPRVGIEFKPAQLVAQIVMQRLRPRHHVGDRVVLAIGVLLHARAGGARPILERVGPLFVEIQQPLEIFLVVLGLVDDQFPFLRRRSIGILFVFDRLVRQVGIVFLLVETGVLGDLLFDPLLKLHDRELQNLHRLDHSRRQNLLLDLLQLLAKRQSHTDTSFLPQQAAAPLHRHDQTLHVILQRHDKKQRCRRARNESKLLPARQGVCQNLLVSKF